MESKSTNSHQNAHKYKKVNVEEAVMQVAIESANYLRSQIPEKCQSVSNPLNINDYEKLLRTLADKSVQK